MVAAKKEAWKMGVSSGHITNLKQSILETFNIYWVTPQTYIEYRSVGDPVLIVVFGWDSSLYIIVKGRESWERFYSDCPVVIDSGKWHIARVVG